MGLNNCVVLLVFLGVCCCVWGQIDSYEELSEEDISSPEEVQEGSLVQVAVVTRHGQRTPKEPYPRDPYRGRHYWPEGWLQLTAEGARQHRSLGRMLRTRYNQTIPLIFTSDHVYIRSTGISRTLASAFALTSALFPDQAIPIHSAPAKYDKLFSPHKSCPAFINEMEEYLSSPRVRREEEGRIPFYKWASEQTGKPFKGVDAAEGLYSLLTIEKQRGLNLPQWTVGAYPQPLKNLTGVFLARSSATRKLARLRYGSLLKDILWHGEHAARRTAKRFLMYSAHDFTIVGLLNCLGVFDGQPSGFASSITFEVRYNSSHGNTLEMLYRNESHAPPVRLTVEQCGSPCHVRKLTTILADILPEDIHRECTLDLKQPAPQSFSCLPENTGFPVSLWIIFTVPFVIISLILLCCSRPLNTFIMVPNKREGYVVL